MEYFIKILFFFITISSCVMHDNLNQVTPDDSRRIIESNMYFLASDELEGREATTPGAKIASQFIANQLKQYGVKPFGDDSTYFQNFTLQKNFALPESEMIFMDSMEQKSLQLGADYIPFEFDKKITGSELIFVGYGISDSNLNYDDYANIDVTGKTVLCMYGVPVKRKDPNYFKKGLNWAGSYAKTDIALKKGAAAIIIIQSNNNISNWKRFSDMFIDGTIDEIKNDRKAINAAWIDSSTTKSLFSLKGLTFSQLRDTLNYGLIPSGTILKPRVTISFKKHSDLLNARNVVGILEGTDNSLNYQFITISAHYDHEGIKNGQIYNGADDNASGTVAILESARQIAAINNNKRPIIFAFMTAEEKGLLGSGYFTNNSEYISDVICNINIDMVGRESPDTIVVIGSGRISDEYYQIVEDANKETVNFHFDYRYDAEEHPERLYYRSDQWEFAQKGIPVVFFTDMHETDYHKPSDDADKINFEKVAKTARLTTHLALKVANLKHKLSVN